MVVSSISYYQQYAAMSISVSSCCIGCLGAPIGLAYYPNVVGRGLLQVRVKVEVLL
jgi:hypothetical protein